ncbi:hypothetical protein CYV26_00855 [Carnobacterium maltaromaticum]|uniref:CgeB family protein n=1 Tax=Carnobacterium maltaromaticum TaxID=2751 RepID=UPI000C762C76|nr:glycosyltransferase [Carnobacterium maltaromaticum]PLS37021.1 hypothetical protein CYV33_05655 [Carnobacterium maltaromaticum]PLS37835.1 hypothetical protein CYV30_05650 [Carnobacterium maltaromaticum]PLS39776.1 hypothetical protein CYV31_03635 [Carnobacterium maltaromaticum]PLS44532.1 hypothetical protein CYV28_05650 [Carnobacterium maltaromaticum]PLS46565.1 hypothetical protein CYV27_05645 [Carnobacterium maltaromaticum]
MNDILSDIKKMREELFHLIDPVILKNQDMLAFDSWFCSHPAINIQKQEDEIIFINTSDQPHYISLIEKNTYFNSLPKTVIEVFPNETISGEMNFDIIGKASVHLAIIEYSHLEKIKSIMYSYKEPFKHTISHQTNSLRVALKISGKGIVTLTSGKIECLHEETLEEYVPCDVAEVAVKRTKKKITKLNQLNIAAILDEFTTTCYQEEVNLIKFTPTNFEQVLTENEPDFLFVESAWKGNKGTWEFKIGKYANQDKSELFKLLAWCKQRDIPTVFWNKEDPIHFDKFIDAAERFDYIYTTDANMIERYQKCCKHTNVYALPFSAQPKFHNPIELPIGRKAKVSFAGSYYANRHVERKNDMDGVLEVAMIKGLDIYDRNFEKNQHAVTDFSFPERFRSSVKGSLPYNKIPIAYKGYEYMVNVNSIKYSPTMFSRRVFEGLASGTPIISSYSEGIKKIFGDIVLIEDADEGLKEKFEKVLKDKRLFKKKKMQGIREVFLNHTYAIRLQFMLKNMGFEINLTEDVTIIVEADTEEDLETVFSMFNQQVYSDKQLLILSNITPKNVGFLELNKQENIQVVMKNNLTKYDHFHDLIPTKYFAYMDTNHFYGKYFIKDLVAGAIYSQADVITKNEYYEYKNHRLLEIGKEKEYRYDNQGHLNFSLVRTNYATMDSFDTFFHKMKQDNTLKDEFSSGRKIFSIDNCNFIKNGADASKNLKVMIEI